MRINELIITAMIAAACLLTAGCNSVPIGGLADKLAVSVHTTSAGEEPVKIDFLWVIDNSSSMCDEQVSLAANFDVFTDKLVTLFELDPQIAVTTMDMHCDPNSEGIGAARGLFAVEPADRFPPACTRELVRTCYSDSDCAGIDLDVYGKNTNGEWKCDEAQSTKCAVNPNGTFNTECKRLCTEDTECQELFDDERYVCLKLSGNQADWGCVLPPATEKCFETDPDTGEVILSGKDPVVREDLQPVLGADNLDLFSCIATVGVNQNKCFKYEQGMAGALSAVDPKGANADQAKSFLRDEAYLVVIFVSDEDDCSADCAYEGANWTECKSKYCGKDEVPVSEGSSDVKTVCTGNLHEDYYETCALLPSRDENVNGQQGVLVPVSHYANQFKALKTDPSRVIVAAIAGDAVTPSGETGESEMLAAIMSALTPKLEGCEVRCEEGTWSDTVNACVPELSDCKNGTWDTLNEECVQDPANPDDVDFGTTSKATGTATGGCVGDVSSADSDDGKPLSDCHDGECYLEDSRELREQMVATVRSVLELGEGTFFSDTDGDGVVDPTSDEIAAIEDLLLGTEDGVSPLEQAFKEVRRVAYTHSKGSPFHCYDTTYMCYSDSGKADWGSRYFELAERFGPNGVFTNLCSEQGIGPALDEIAAKIISVVNKMCLPKYPAEGTTLRVTKTITDANDPDNLITYELVESENAGPESSCPAGLPAGLTCTYTYLSVGGDDCRGTNGEQLPAIIFGDEPQPGEKIEVSYEGAPPSDGL